MMIIAVPVDSGEIFQHFGKTSSFAIFDIANKKIVKKEIVSTGGQGHSSLGEFLANKKVEIVICGGIGSGAVAFLENYKIKVYAGNSGKVDKIVDDFINDKLVQKMESTCDCHDEHEEVHDCSCHDHCD